MCVCGWDFVCMESYRQWIETGVDCGQKTINPERKRKAIVHTQKNEKEANIQEGFHKEN